MVTRLLARFALEAPVRQLIARLVQLFVLCLFVIMAMQNLGVELLPLVAGLGVAGAGIALALQGVLGNIVAGLTIIFTQPFHVGDYISIGDEEGEVLDISLFNTTLGTRTARASSFRAARSSAKSCITAARSAACRCSPTSPRYRHRYGAGLGQRGAGGQ